MRSWKPRELSIGRTIPLSGHPEDYPSNSPEQKLAEFLTLWQEKNYGHMAKCYAPMLGLRPQEVRENFGKMELSKFEIVKIIERSPFAADIQVYMDYIFELQKNSSLFEFRLILNSQDGDLAYFPSVTTRWGVANWRNANLS